MWPSAHLSYSVRIVETGILRDTYFVARETLFSIVVGFEGAYAKTPDICVWGLCVFTL